MLLVLNGCQLCPFPIVIHTRDLGVWSLFLLSICFLTPLGDSPGVRGPSTSSMGASLPVSLWWHRNARQGQWWGPGEGCTL